MKYLSLFVVLIFSGCATLDPLLNPKSAQDISVEKIDSWAAKQTAQLAKTFEQGFPLHRQATRGKSPSTEWLNADQLNKFQQGFEAVSDEAVREKLKNYDKPMKELRAAYDDLGAALFILKSSENFVDSKISQAGITLSSDLNLSFAELFSYCQKINAPSGNCSADFVGPKLVRESLYEKHPEIRDYRVWLADAGQSAGSAKNLIEQYGLKKEASFYLDRARSSGCSKVVRFNFWDNNTALSRSVPYGNAQPNDESVYDLAGFKVLQSTNNGVLLKPNYSDAYNAQPIFVRTEREYADGFTFNGGDQLVCSTGKIKEYLSILGAKRKIYSFNAISDGNTYYFLPWGE
jgi:hypothetical protein